MKFIHTADWQIGRPFANVEDPHKRSLLQQERIDVLKRIGERVREENAAFVVVAGDVFDSTRVDQATVSVACSAIGALEVPVFVIPGNHDHGGAGSVWEQAFFQREQKALAPNLQILLEATPLILDTAVILPCPLLRRSEATDTTAWLRNEGVYEDLPNDRPRIILAHGSTHQFTSRTDADEADGDASNLLDLRLLPEGEIDYIALGDWHGTKQVLPHAWYAGTPELDRFPKGSDHQPGNVLSVEIARSTSPTVSVLPTARFRWQHLTFHFTEDATLVRFEEQLSDILRHRAGEDLLRLSLGGTLGIQAAAELEQKLESLRARLLRLRLLNEVVVVPSEEEMEALTRRSSDPLIARVAEQLVAQTRVEGDDAAVARLALRQLYAACTASL